MRVWTSRLSVALALVVTAADAPAQPVTAGIKGGVVLGSLSMSGPGAFQTSADPGGMAGGFLALSLGEVFRLQPEVYWSVRRFAASGVPNAFTVSSRGVEAPILVQARFPRARSAQATVFGGPQVSWIRSVNQRLDDETRDITDFVRTTDVAMVFGAGLERALTTGAVVVDVRAVIGVRNLATDVGLSQKSRALQVLAGYRF